MNHNNNINTLLGNVAEDFKMNHNNNINTLLGNVAEDFKDRDNSVLILQQANCTAVRVKEGSLAYALSQVLPLSNPYRFRKRGPHQQNLASCATRDSLGSIFIVNSGTNRPLVANLFAQYAMGPPHKYYASANCNVDKTYKRTCHILDTLSGREHAFTICLQKLFKWLQTNVLGQNVKTIIIPYGIGCTSAGGSWPKYYNIIMECLVNKLKDIDILIVKLRGK